SSRRRHTRSKRDWSSDVCSSDLPEGATGVATEKFTCNRLPQKATVGGVHGASPGGDQHEYCSSRGWSDAFLQTEEAFVTIWEAKRAGASRALTPGWRNARN